MASAAKITEILPETLPEDFGGWDEEKYPSAQAVRVGAAYVPGIAVLPKPATPPAWSPAALTAPGNLLRSAVVPAFRSSIPTVAESRSARKKWPIFAGTGAALVVVLAAVLIPILNSTKALQANPAATPAPTVTSVAQPENPAPQLSIASAAVPAPAQSASAAQQAQATSDPASALRPNSAGPSRAQAQMMNTQLSAPSRIHMTAVPAVQAPPAGGIPVAEMDASGNGNAFGSIFGSAKQPKVQAAAPKVVNVSAVVAFGLLIHKTPPVYPRIAKDSRISGTVLLRAHISKTGTVEDLRVVSGPVMLQEAAVNAVRTWRYKPYMINDQPTDINTTVSVTFSLTD